MTSQSRQSKTQELTSSYKDLTHPVKYLTEDIQPKSRLSWALKKLLNSSFDLQDLKTVAIIKVGRVCICQSLCVDVRGLLCEVISFPSPLHVSR